MTPEILLAEPGRVEEPHAVQEYSDVLTKVAAEGKAIVLCRNGADLAAVIPMRQLELVRALLARQDAEQLAAEIDWAKFSASQPPQDWFDDADNPFEAD
jgi:ABC-type histidine transport system ATPase subunit